MQQLLLFTKQQKSLKFLPHFELLYRFKLLKSGFTYPQYLRLQMCQHPSFLKWFGNEPLKFWRQKDEFQNKQAKHNRKHLPKQQLRLDNFILKMKSIALFENCLLSSNHQSRCHLLNLISSQILFQIAILRMIVRDFSRNCLL